MFSTSAVPSFQHQFAVLKVECIQQAGQGCGAVQVLSEAGAAGLNVVEIAKRIQRQGLRDLRTAKSPEVGAVCFVNSTLLGIPITPDRPSSSC